MEGRGSPLQRGPCAAAVRTLEWGPSVVAVTPRDLDQCGWQCHAVEDSVADSSDLRRWGAEQRWWLLGEEDSGNFQGQIMVLKRWGFKTHHHKSQTAIA